MYIQGLGLPAGLPEAEPLCVLVCSRGRVWEKSNQPTAWLLGELFGIRETKADMSLFLNDSTL